MADEPGKVLPGVAWKIKDCLHACGEPVNLNRLARESFSDVRAAVIEPRTTGEAAFTAYKTLVVG